MPLKSLNTKAEMLFKIEKKFSRILLSVILIETRDGEGTRPERKARRRY